MNSNRLAAGWQCYISTARDCLWAPAQSGPSQTACLQNQPAAPGEPAILLRLLFSRLTHIHPAWSACQTLCLPSRPPSPFLPLFLCSTGLVKVSQSPVALLYRLQCFLFKWRHLSCEYPCKAWLGCSSSFSSSAHCLVIFVFFYLWTSELFNSILLSGHLSLTVTRGEAGCSVCLLRARLTKKKPCSWQMSPIGLLLKALWRDVWRMLQSCFEVTLPLIDASNHVL